MDRNKSKGINIDRDLWKELMLLKMEGGYKNVSDVIKDLLDRADLEEE